MNRLSSPFSHLLFLLCALCFLAPCLAMAYVMPAEQVLGKSARAMGGLNSLEVREQVKYFQADREWEGGDGVSLTSRALAERVTEVRARAANFNAPAAAEPDAKAKTAEAQKTSDVPAAPEPVLQLTGTVQYKFSGQYREELEGPGLKTLVAVSHGRAVKLFNDRLFSQSQDLYDHFKDLLLFRGGKSLAQAMLMDGVDTEVVSLGRWENRVVYVVGAQYPDETFPQVWIDRKTWLPIRWLVTRWVPGHESTSLEVRFDNWQYLMAGEKKKGAYPGVVTTLLGNKPYSERKMTSYTVNPPLSSRLFDVRRIRETALPSPGMREEENTSADMDEIKRLINDFKKMVPKAE